MPPHTDSQHRHHRSGRHSAGQHQRSERVRWVERAGVSDRADRRRRRLVPDLVLRLLRRHPGGAMPDLHGTVPTNIWTPIAKDVPSERMPHDHFLCHSTRRSWWSCWLRTSCWAFSFWSRWTKHCVCLRRSCSDCGRTAARKPRSGTWSSVAYVLHRPFLSVNGSINLWYNHYLSIPSSSNAAAWMRPPNGAPLCRTAVAPAPVSAQSTMCSHAAVHPSPTRTWPTTVTFWRTSRWAPPPCSWSASCSRASWWAASRVPTVATSKNGTPIARSSRGAVWTIQYANRHFL